MWILLATLGLARADDAFTAKAATLAGDDLRENGDPQGAIARYEEAVAIYRDLHIDETIPITPCVNASLAAAWVEAGDPIRALQAWDEAFLVLEARDVVILYPECAVRLVDGGATVHPTLGEADGAAFADRVMAGIAKVSTDHDDVELTLINDDAPEASRAFVAAWLDAKRMPGWRDRYWSAVSRLDRLRQRRESADPATLEALIGELGDVARTFEALVGPDHPRTAEALYELGSAAWQLRLPSAGEVLEESARRFGLGGPYAAGQLAAWTRAARAWQDVEKPERAWPALQEALAVGPVDLSSHAQEAAPELLWVASRQGMGDDRVARLRALNATFANAWEDPAERERVLDELAADPASEGLVASLVAQMREQAASDVAALAEADRTLATAADLAEAGRWRKALKLELPALATVLELRGFIPYVTAGRRVVAHHQGLEQWEAAAATTEAMAGVVAAEKGPDHEVTAKWYRFAAEAWVKAGRHDRAAPWLDRAIAWGEAHWGPDEASMEAAAMLELAALRQGHAVRRKRPDDADALGRAFQQAASRVWPDPAELGEWLAAGSMVLAISDDPATVELGAWLLAPDAVALPPFVAVDWHLPDGAPGHDALRTVVSRWQEVDRAVAADVLTLGTLRVEGKDAAGWAEVVFALAADVLAEDPDAHARLLALLASRAGSAGEGGLAVAYAQEAVAVSRAADLPDDRLAELWLDLGEALRGAGQGGEALAALREADAAAIRAFGADSPERVPYLGELGWELLTAQRLEEAAPLLIEAVAIDAAHGGPRWSTAVYWKAAALLAEAVGRPEEAQRMLALAEAAIARPEIPDAGAYALSLAALGRAAFDAGRYEEARQQLDRAAEVVEGMRTPDPAVAAQVDEALALVLVETGDWAAAARVARRAEDRFAEAGDPAGAARALLVQGRAALAVGDLAAAEELLTGALSASRSADPLPEARARVGLAELRLAQGRPDEALALYDEAIAAIEGAGSALEALGLGIARSRASLAAGDAEGAYAAAHEASLLARGVSNATDLARAELVETWVAEARALVALGDTARARESLAQASTEAARAMERLLAATSERERMAVLRARRELLDDTVAYGAADAATAWAAVLDWKGAVAQALLAERAALARTKDPEAKRLAGELAQVRADLATAVYSDAPDAPAQVGELTTRKEQLEKALAATLAADGPPAAPAIGEVCAALPDGAVLVDYLRFDAFRPEGAVARYVAFVVGRDCAVRRVDLGDAAAIDAAVASYRSKLERGLRDTGAIDRAAARVRELVWDPLGLSRGTVLLVPDAALNGVAFAGLPLDDGTYLVEHVTVGHLDNARDVVRLAKPARGLGQRALLVGGVDYDLSGRDGPVATSRAACMGGTFPALAATGPEAEAVAGLLQGRVRDLDLLRGAEATEARVAAAASDARYVHLATHGFFATGSCASALGDTRGVKVAQGSAAPVAPTGAGFNPMVLSGLVLAGANPRDDGEDGDGIWTAEEAASLDLGRTELVVLSACETGLGEVASGEGVMGLRRAFAQAGARTLVLSLWTVEDEPTRALMTDLYVGLDRDLGKLDALREAQLALLAANRAAGDAKPWTWSAFIASGDWAP